MEPTNPTTMVMIAAIRMNHRNESTQLKRNLRVLTGLIFVAVVTGCWDYREKPRSQTWDRGFLLLV